MKIDVLVMLRACVGETETESVSVNVYFGPYCEIGTLVQVNE